MAPIRLGVVGLSAHGSWASQAHLPYLQHTTAYQITALQNSSAESARKARDQYHLPSEVTCHNDITSLTHDPNVDLVMISVKVPHHYPLVKAALEARKDVFVEWPLAATLQQAEELTSLAHTYQVKTIVGLQARQNPSIRLARQLVASGELGTILGTTMLGSGMIFGAQVTESTLYTLPIEHGANLITIPAGHAVDALCFVLGEFKSLQATLAVNYPEAELVGTEGAGKKFPKTIHDYMAFTAEMVRGGVATVVFQAGESRTGKNFYWEINGTEGSLVLEAEKGFVQMYHPTLKFAKSGEELKEVPVERADGFDYNVGVAWDAFVGKGPGSVTTFEDALVRHRMIDAIYRSHEKGTRESYL